jgi:hypothetical protein
VFLVDDANINAIPIDKDVKLMFENIKDLRDFLDLIEEEHGKEGG